MIANDYKNFVDSLTYCSTGDLDAYNRSHAMRELEYYISHPNNSTYDVIDYERLIYIEMRFADDPEVMRQLTQLKNIICKNYILRKKLLNRLGAYD